MVPLLLYFAWNKLVLNLLVFMKNGTFVQNALMLLADSFFSAKNVSTDMNKLDEIAIKTMFLLSPKLNWDFFPPIYPGITLTPVIQF